MKSLHVRRIMSAIVGAGLLGALPCRTGAAEGKQAGRVEGVLKIGAKPGAHQDVILVRNDPPPFRKRARPEPLRVETDEKGRFVFEDVEPGEWRVGIFKAYPLRNKGGYTRTSTPSHAVPFHLAPGQTANVQVGGTGRPVVGQLVPPKGQKVALAYEGGSFRRVWNETPRTRSPEGLSDDERNAWYKSHYRSEKGLAEWRARRSYVVDVEPDGSFRIEDVPAGTYRGQIEVARWGEEIGRASGRASLSFTVPEIPGGRSDKPIDLGKIEVQFRRPDRLTVGMPAPDFSVQALDGKPIGLADFRGKLVLLDFWATWCGPCKAETPHLKAVWDRFGKDPRFAMVSLSFDRSPDAPREYAKKKGLDWVHGFAKGGFKSDVAKAYDIRGIPTILLVGPDGTIVATKLRGKRIAPAIEAALANVPKPGAASKPTF